MRLMCSPDFLSLSRFHPDTIQAQTYQLDNGTQIEVIAPGIIACTPTTPYQKAVVLSSGVHGNETAPIEICSAILNDILNNKLQLKQRVLFLFGNLTAMNQATRFVEENMNRLFMSDLADTSLEARRANVLMQAMNTFFVSSSSAERLHYDLHTAIRPSINEKFAVYPFLNGKPYSKAQLAFLNSCGVSTILLSQSPTTTFSYYSSVSHQAHAFTIELGKVMPFGENEMQRFVQVDRSLRALLSQRKILLDESVVTTMDIYSVNQVINKNQPDFSLHFPEDAPNFSQFAAGELLASETGKQYYSQQDGEAIVFPNANVAIGQRALLTVVPHTLDE